MTAFALGPKNLSRTRIQYKAVKNRKRSDLIAGRSDRLTEICFSPN